MHPVGVVAPIFVSDQLGFGSTRFWCENPGCSQKVGSRRAFMVAKGSLTP